MPWQLEPLGDRHSSEPQSTTGPWKHWSALRRSLFGPRDSTSDESARELEQLAGERIAAVTPESDWSALVEAVNREVDARDPRAGLVLIGPPGGGVAEALGRWATEHDLAILEPPEPHELFGEPRLEVDANETLVLPELHKFYLRHPAGLRALRNLMETLRERRAGLVLGCDSWAWAYLCKSVQIDAVLPDAHATAALGGAELQTWLCSLYESCDTQPDRFRFSADDSAVFGDGVEPAPYFDALARSSNGVPEVALALWQSGLRSARDEEDPTRARTVWVLPPSCWVPPTVSAGLERLDLIVLHTLLLHGGLPEDVLHRLLPFDPARVTRSLLALREFAREEGGLWRVRFLAYPEARALLAREGFLVDDF